MKAISVTCCLVLIGMLGGCGAETAEVANAGPSKQAAGGIALTEADLRRRAELHEMMLNGRMLHDGSLELERIGDISSVPALMTVLKENPPRANGTMVCTSAHALIALRKHTGANPGIRFEDWDAWKKHQEDNAQ